MHLRCRSVLPASSPHVLMGCCLAAAAAAVPQHQAETTTRAMALYESFRPEVPKGKAGWGQNGMFRLARVMELRDQLLQEASCVKASGQRTGKHEFP